MCWSIRTQSHLWHHDTWLTLIEEIVCCLTTQSHYLNQCWLIVSWNLHPQWNLNQNIKPLFQENNILAIIFFRPRCVNVVKIKSENISAPPSDEFFAHMGEVDEGRRASRKRYMMELYSQKILQEFYRPYNIELSNFLGDRKYGWGY